MTEEMPKEETGLSQEELEYKIEIATQTLDRNISFIANCDNKTSIVLATVGALLTIILTNEGLNEIFNIVKSCIETKNFCNIFFLICFASATFILGIGLFNLGRVLVAKTTEEAIGRKDENSRIFFAGIRKSGDYKTYNQRFYAMSKESLLNDLIEQIYINADIATTKYKTYSVGLRRTVVGFVLFVLLLLVGVYIY
jgi:hypothetical protein